jgi:hypothetical protein
MKSKLGKKVWFICNNQVYSGTLWRIEKHETITKSKRVKWTEYIMANTDGRSMKVFKSEKAALRRLNDKVRKDRKPGKKARL